MSGRKARRTAVCPFVDSADPRCATHLTLRNINRAFAQCADRYILCPVYQSRMTELLSDERHPDRNEVPFVLAAS